MDSSSSSPSTQRVEEKSSSPASSTNTTITTALYGIVPAVASTACCWGPPLWISVAGATSGGVLVARRMARYRPYLLGLSATMMAYSFTRVYAPELLRDVPGFPFLGNTNKEQQQQQQQYDCCHDNHSNSNITTTSSTTQQQPRVDDNHPSNLQFQRAVVWASLVVAVAGASYGRVNLPTTTTQRFLRRMKSPTTGTNARTNSSSSSSCNRMTNPSTTTKSVMELSVDGMACAGCANKVQSAIHQTLAQQQQHKADGDDNDTILIDVDHKTGKVTLRALDTEHHKDEHVVVDYSTLQQAIEKAGYHIRD